MPVKKESLYPHDWFEIHLQQAVEKYLKGYLLSRGWPLKRVHDLEYLQTDITSNLNKALLLIKKLKSA